MPAQLGEGAVETPFGRVTFQVIRGPNGSFTIPRGTVMTFPDGRVMGTIAHEVPLNGFSPTSVSVSGDTTQFNFNSRPGSGIRFENIPDVPVESPRPIAKSAIERILEDEELV